MPRRAFDQELQRLQDDILALGSMVEVALVQSVVDLKARNFAGSRRLVAADRTINEKRYAIEADSLTLIATQQPMAGDMRLLAAILEIAGELERMGDYAKGIARIHLLIGEQPLIKPLIDLPVMADKVSAMLHQALQAFAQRDVQRARTIPQGDDEIDCLYRHIYRELMTHLKEDPHNIEQANQLLWVAHNLERAADRVGNLCERVIYTVTGEFVDLSDEASGVESVS
jgi:phosphate transport system protein